MVIGLWAGLLVGLIVGFYLGIVFVEGEKRDAARDQHGSNPTKHPNHGGS